MVKAGHYSTEDSEMPLEDGELAAEAVPFSENQIIFLYVNDIARTDVFPDVRQK
jgi:hypothetical protein